MSKPTTLALACKRKILDNLIRSKFDLERLSDTVFDSHLDDLNDKFKVNGYFRNIIATLEDTQVLVSRFMREE